jgi:hypothetical protein
MQAMSELSEMNCDDLADVAVELALGVLTGRERARAIVHLEGCSTCRDHVRQLAVTAEELLGLLPVSEPPAGFETRVMSRLGPAGRHRRRRPAATRWMLAAAAATVIGAACGLGGWGLRGTAPASQPAASSQQPALRLAALTMASHQVIGTVFLYGGSSGWLYMTVDTGSGTGTVTCQLEDRAGHIISIGSFWLNGGYGFWGSPEPVPAAAVAGARLTAADGRIVATARFSARK